MDFKLIEKEIPKVDNKPKLFALTLYHDYQNHKKN